MSDPLLGRILGGRYRIERLLGAGGMGAVYEATQVDIRRRVALKVLRASAATADQRARFEREARALSQVNSPHVVEIRDFQALPDEPPLLVMEYLEGRSLSALVKDEGVLAAPRVAKIALQMLAALAEAHRHRIIHRDIKPANVVLVPSPALGEIVKVVDFGVSTADVTQIPRTLGTAFVGTLSYMAPEQALGEAVDGRADVYGVGATMYYALSKRRPIEADNAIAAVDMLVRTRVAKLATHRPDLDPALAAIVDRALEHEPAGRFQSADEMADALRRWIEERASAPPPAPPPTQKVEPPPSALATVAQRPAAPVLAPRRRVWPFAVFALALLAVAAVTFALAMSRRAPAAVIAAQDAGSGPPASVDVPASAPSAMHVDPQLIEATTAPVTPSATAPAHPVGGASSHAVPRAQDGLEWGANERWTGTTCASSNECPSHTFCRGGRCLCGVWEVWCRGDCIFRDVDNCGGCGKPCPTGRVCVAPHEPEHVACLTCEELEQARGSAPGTLKLCPGTSVCVDLTSNLFHCGQCGHACDPSRHESCQAGKCVAVYH